jgi:hypothetical protein
MQVSYLSQEELYNSAIQKTVNEAHGTHKEFLQFYIQKTSGNILEFGTGHNSTGLIRNLIEGTNRKLVSYENNREWYNKMKEIYPENKNHQYVFIEGDWESAISVLPKFDWSIVFIDQSPWDARRLTMEHFKDTAEYVLIHDVDYFNKNNIFGTVLPDNTLDFSDISSNWRVYYPEKPWPAPTGPPLLVFSNTGKQLFDIKGQPREQCNMIGCGIVRCSCYI